MSERRGPDNEREFAERLRAHLDGAVRHIDAEELVDAVAAKAARPRAARAWAPVAIATVVLAGILTVAGIGLLSPGPSPTPSASVPANATPTPQPSKTASTPPSLTGPEVEAAGSTGLGGIWARRGSTLYISTDGGTSWTTGSIDPAPYSVDVLDANRAWTVTLATGSSKDTGSPTDVLHFAVNRTRDGGQSWTSVPIDGTFAALRPVLSFPDALHGFLLLSRERFATQQSAVYRTDDGGATWRMVGTAPSLGPQFVAVDSLRLFAGAAESAAAVKLWPTLAWSQDGGATWRDVQISTSMTALLQPPTFFGSDGVVPVLDEQSTVRLLRSHDGGAAWSEVGRGLYLGQIGPGAFVDREQWILASRDGSRSMVVITGDGTKWGGFIGSGLPSAAPSWIGFVDANHGALLAPLGDTPAPSGLFITQDGGRTWSPARLPHG